MEIMNKMFFAFLLGTIPNISFSQYSTEFVDVYKMDTNNEMHKRATKRFPADITVNAKNIFIFDKTSGDKDVYDVVDKVVENGRKVTFTTNQKTKRSYKFTIIDGKVSVLYDYDESSDTYKSGLMFRN